MLNEFLQPVRPADPRGMRRALNARAWLLLSGSAAATLLLAQSIRDQDPLEFSVIRLPVEQIGQPVDIGDPIGIKWSRAAMYDPLRAVQLREQLKTQERKDAEANAQLAITDPEEFRKRQRTSESERPPKTPAEESADAQASQARSEALRVILHPVEAAREFEKTKTPAMRRREEAAAYSILNPHEFNQLIDKNKTPEIRRKEADALISFTEPERFLADRQWFRKTGSHERPKGAETATDPEFSKPASNPRPNRPEKGTEGGTQ